MPATSAAPPTAPAAPAAPSAPSPPTTSAKSMPRGTFGLLVLILVLSVGSIASPNMAMHFTLIPGNTLLGEHTFWNLITGSLVELAPVKLVPTLLFVAMFGAAAERAMGTTAYMLHLLATTAMCGIATSFGALLHYIGTQGNEEYFYGQVYGAAGLCVAISVALHQADPAAPVLGLPQLQQTHLPLVVLTVAVSGEYLVAGSQDVPFAVVGFVASWTYLRFFQPKPDGSSGDRSSTMEFITLFPAAARPILRPVVKAIGAVFLNLGVFKHAPLPARGAGSSARAASRLKAGGAHAPRVGDAPIADPVSERRRARALKALDQKLAELSSRKAPKPATATATGTAASAATATTAPRPATGSSSSTGEKASAV